MSKHFDIQAIIVLFAFLVVTAGCGLPQSDACEAYVACQRHYDTVFDRNETDTNIYQPDGVCWENQDFADECSADCEENTARLRERLTESEQELGPCG